MPSPAASGYESSFKVVKFVDERSGGIIPLNLRYSLDGDSRSGLFNYVEGATSVH